jgi:hypothetical protein
MPDPTGEITQEEVNLRYNARFNTSITDQGTKSQEFTARFGPGTTSFAMGIFRYCTGIKYVEVPEGVTVFKGGYTFSGCTALDSIVLPASLSDIQHGGYGAFEGCTRLRKVTCHNPTPPTCSSSFTFSGTMANREL